MDNHVDNVDNPKDIPSILCSLCKTEAAEKYDQKAAAPGRNAPEAKISCKLC